jgi:hypothetical protein
MYKQEKGGTQLREEGWYNKEHLTFMSDEICLALQAWSIKPTVAKITASTSFQNAEQAT